MKARINGGELRYEAQGRGPAVLFLHAFPLGLFMWDSQAAALAASHTVVRFDFRGFGESPPGDGLLTMERISDDAAALLDHLGLAKAVVCGCSMGGYAAFAMLRRHPARIQGLVLQDTRSPADTEEGRQSRALLAERVLKEGASAVADAFVPKLLGETTHKERPQLVERLRAAILATPARGIADALAGLSARADSTPTLREIRVPSLVICGAEDVLTPPADSEAMAAAILGARLTIVPKAGHLANLENPEAFNAAFVAFVRGIPA